MVQLKRIPDTGASSITAANARYIFGLGKETATSRWSVTDYEYPPREGTAIVGRMASYMAYLKFPFRIGMFALEKIIHDEHFQLLDCREVESEGRQLVRIEYDWLDPEDHRYSGSPGQRLRYWAILDPKLDWAVVECEEEVSWGHSHHQIEYGRTAAGIPFPTKLVRRLVGTQASVTETLSYLPPERCTAPASDFTLTAFGLPELGPSPQPDTVSSRFQRFLWANIVLGVAILLAAWFWRRNRRHSISNGSAE